MLFWSTSNFSMSSSIFFFWWGKNCKWNSFLTRLTSLLFVVYSMNVYMKYYITMKIFYFVSFSCKIPFVYLFVILVKNLLFEFLIFLSVRFFYLRCCFFSIAINLFHMLTIDCVKSPSFLSTIFTFSLNFFSWWWNHFKKIVRKKNEKSHAIKSSLKTFRHKNSFL